MPDPNFQASLARAKKELEKDILKINMLTTTAVFNAVVYNSVVLTGLFRDNWQPSIGSPLANTVALGNKADIEGRISGMQLSDTIYLTNNVAYSETLVDNPSPRWIDVEVAKAKDYIIRFAATVGAE